MENVECRCTQLPRQNYSLGLAKEADHPEILNGTERDPVASYPQEISFLIM